MRCWSFSKRTIQFCVLAAAGILRMAGAAPPLVSPALVMPGAGSGPSQTFTFAYSDSAGAQNLGVVNVLINNALDGRHACYIAFVPSGANSGSVFLVDDAGDAGGPYQGMTLPGTGSVQNSQCSIDGSASFAASSGNVLSLTLAIMFSPGFAGNSILYLSARDTASNNSGWQALGTWSVTGAAPPSGPSVSGMGPARSRSVNQPYTFTFNDSNGYQDVTVANVLINGAIDGRHACYLAFVPTSGTAGSLYLVDDAGDAGGPYSGMVIPGNGSVSNGQCTISGAGSSVSGNGNNLTLTLSIAFTQAFAGNQVFYLAARNNTLNSGWQASGSNTVSYDAIISSSAPVSNPAGATLAVALPVLNIGAGDATTVQVTSAALGGAAAAGPTLPQSLGTIKAGSSALLNLNFGSGSLTVGTSYVLSVAGTWQSGTAAAQLFTINTIITYGAPDLFLAPPKPLNVTPTLDSADSVTQAISAANGGTITATGADGTVFTLTLPPNALLGDEQITLTPVSAIAGLPVSGGLLAAVQLDPDGLELQQAATLTIQPVASVPVNQQVGFGCHADGSEFYFQPLGLTNSITIPILHFSTPGVGKGSAGNAGTPTDPQDRFDQALADLGTKARSCALLGGSNCGDPIQQADEAGLFQDNFDQVIQKKLDAAATDDTKADDANAAALAWERRLALTGLIDTDGNATSKYDKDVTYIKNASQAAIVNAYNRAFSRCTATTSAAARIKEAQTMTEEERKLELLGGGGMPNFASQLTACLATPLTLASLDSIATTSFLNGETSTSSHVTAQSIPLQFDSASLHYKGSGPLAYASFTYFEDGDSCTPTATGVSGTVGVDVSLNPNAFKVQSGTPLQVRLVPNVMEIVTRYYNHGGGCVADTPMGFGFYINAVGGTTPGFLYYGATFNVTYRILRSANPLPGLSATQNTGFLISASQ
jgi:hypothetical protein